MTKNLNFSLLRWYGMQLLMRFSLPAILCGLLLCLVLMTYWLKIVPMLDQIAVAQLQTKQLAKQSTAEKPVEVNETLPVQMQVAEFYKRFPHPKLLPDLLAQINDEAMAHRLTLDKGDYNLRRLQSKQANQSQSPLTQYEITLPIQGDYENIRVFMNGLIASMPMLAITDVQMVRETIKSRTVEARIRLVLFFNELSKGDA